MKIIASGFSGLIGEALQTYWQAQGHQIIQLVRHQSDKTAANQAIWDPSSQSLDPSILEGADVIIHLGGAGIADRAWTKSYKQTIEDSRIHSTRLLAKTIETLKDPPSVFLVASAIGIYGDRQDAPLTETSQPGSSWLANVAVKWESASKLPDQHPTRVVNLRLGIVISPDGGALAKMLTPFKLGLGGPVGNGRQFWSWIGLNDVVRAIDFCTTSDIAGPVNLVSPQPLSNRDFSKILARSLHRPSLIPVPAFAISLAMGEMGRTLLLESAKVLPDKLRAAGFEFDTPTLEETLAKLLP